MAHNRRLAVLAGHLTEAGPSGPCAPAVAPQPTCAATHAGDWVYAAQRSHSPTAAAPWAPQRPAARPARTQRGLDAPLAMQHTSGDATHAGSWTYAVSRAHSAAVAAPWAAQKRAPRPQPRGVDAPLAMQHTAGDATHSGSWSYAVSRDFDPAVAAPWAHQRRAPARPARAPRGLDGPLAVQHTCGGSYAGDWSYAVSRDFDPAVAAPWAHQQQAPSAQPKPAKQPLGVSLPQPAL